GLAVVDSQNLAGDPWVGLALAAHETERLRLGTAVTNPVTRHPAVTAAAAVTLQVASAGRFFLGIGRGDSALAHLGRAPASVATFDRYLAVLRSEEHTSELQSLAYIVCRLLLATKKRILAPPLCSLLDTRAVR